MPKSDPRDRLSYPYLTLMYVVVVVIVVVVLLLLYICLWQVTYNVTKGQLRISF